MMQTNNRLLSNTTGIVILVVTITIIGSALRLFFVLRVDFPLNDGGMFSLMTRELVENHFRLPEFTRYNFLQIPFAYPPLPFYLAGLLHQITGLNLILIYQYFPAAISILTIPVFFLLSREILDRDNPAIHSTLVFAILPPGYEWLIMGGGVARAPAFLFSLLALWLSIRALKRRSRKALALGILFASLTALSHLEIFLVTSVWIALAAWFVSRDRWGITVILAVGVGSALLSAPWWLTVVAEHGFNPYVNALGAGEFNLVVSFADLLLRNLSEEFLFTPILVFGMLGLFRQIVKKEWLLPAWVFAVALVDPRSLERSLSIPLSILVGIAIDEILLPGMDRFASKDLLKQRIFPNLLGALLIAYILLRTAITSPLYMLAYAHVFDVLSVEDRQAMGWIDRTTSPDESFLVLSPPIIWETNRINEWFPVLSQRKSVSTVQGTEWLPDSQFDRRKTFYETMQKCVLETTTRCLMDALSEEPYAHVYLSGKLVDRVSGVQFPLPIETALRESPDFTLSYEDKQVMVFSLVK